MSQHPVVNTTVKTTVTPRTSNSGHDAGKSAACLIYEIVVTNHITINQFNEGSEEVTHGSLEATTDKPNRCPCVLKEDSEKNRYDRPDYEKYVGVGSYKLHQSPRTWSEAKRICEEEGAHLLEINSKTEEEVIKRLIAHHRRLFIGLRYKRQEDYFDTVGEPVRLTEYGKWIKKSDYNDSSDLCSAISPTGEIVKVSCNDINGFICEMPA
ncbi:hemolymph lipopolysaccharide-binding protein-like [Schistocerca nitens]|uniref:hemolymph lipopolysaccharide-binding protein-like n=1 Tax=Schistocerca nitens TaxID=7011 RepID=UPI0021191D26|nr:hemolymph lipopolysaccharide-binding protein-like [Schistocerca nitens]